MVASQGSSGIRKFLHIAMALGLCAAGSASYVAAQAPAAPGASAPTTAPDGQAAPGARRGGGRGGRGGAMTPEDQAAIAKLSQLPLWKPGVGDGDYMMEPPQGPAPENAVREGVPKGKVVTFQMEMEGSMFYPPSPARGVITNAPALANGRRGENANPPVPVRGGATTAPATREVSIYIPANYVPGTPLPFMFCHDAMGLHDNVPAPYLPAILDNMIADKRLPAMFAVMVMPSNQRSMEYDTVSGKFAEYVEAEILPRLEKDYGVVFSKDPNARGVLGGSSGGAAAMSMAWFHPEWYRRVLVFSGTFVSLRPGPDAPHGAWEYHENFIPKTTPNKPLRIWLEVGENDNGANGSSAGMGNWVIANQRMAEVLKAKGYAYQFVFAKGAGHVDRPVRAATLAPALEWLWKDYKPAAN